MDVFCVAGLASSVMPRYLASMLDEKTIQHLASRAASILCVWAGLDPMRKNDNGDRSSPASGLTMILGAMADKGAPLPSDAHARLTQAIAVRLAAKAKEREGIYFTLDVDYHPGRELTEISAAAGLAVSWPIKSHLCITSPYSDGSGDLSVSDAQGYGRPATTYKLLSEDRGWLITTGFTVDRKIADLCLDAAKAGHPDLKWESLTA